MSDNIVRLEDVSHGYGALEVIRDLNLEVARGEFVAVVGPSGSGKTTLLNLISGYLAPTRGTIARRGRSCMVYQDDGLFPWLTARQNIALGLHAQGAAASRNGRLGAWLERIGLNGFADHYPHQLSGGMRQRVELARALAVEAELLLLDEPFSALDYLTRMQMRGELARLLAESPRTVLLVTHHLEEAAQLADRIVLLAGRPGRIVGELRLTTPPRPRRTTDPAVVEAVERLLRALGAETDPPLISHFADRQRSAGGVV
jgi:ABC-type nitrate/sulfonate/bicarbonate transport system ATPase subunit